MNIHVATKDELSVDVLGSFLSKNRFLPYAEYGIPLDNLVNYVIGDLRDSEEKGASVLLAEENNTVLGILSVVKSKWDSNHFGTEIANIRYLFTLGDYLEKKQHTKELLSHLSRLSGFSLLITRTHTEDTPLIHALEDSSFQLMDTLVTHYFDFKNKVVDFKETCKIELLKDEIPELKKIARTSFSEAKVATDHFHADRRLDEAKSDALYEHWIEEASKDKESIVLVAKINDHPVGFTTSGLNHRLNSYTSKKIGTLILSAVSPEYRNAQIYTSMINATLRWFSDKADIAELGTQIGNYPVQRVWPKLGTKIVRSQNTWHKWM